MDYLAKKISDSELKVMRHLWNADRELTLSEVLKEVSATTEWEPSTIKTLLYRLCKKGVVRQEKRKVAYFSPLISAQQYSDYVTKTVIDNLYNGSAKSLVCALLDSNRLSKSEISSLREMFLVSSRKEGD